MLVNIQDFERLVNDLRTTPIHRKLISEKQLETILEKRLKEKQYEVLRQTSSINGRTDLVVKFGVAKVCIELKKHAFATVLSQLDRYSIEHDAIILGCWQASKPVKEVMKIAKKSSNIPVELVELRSEQSLW